MTERWIPSHEIQSEGLRIQPSQLNRGDRAGIIVQPGLSGQPVRYLNEPTRKGDDPNRTLNEPAQDKSLASEKPLHIFN